MDELRMRQRISRVLAAFETWEQEHGARRILVTSAAAAGLTLGLGACPAEQQPQAPDAATIAAPMPEAAAIAAPVPDPAVRALYAEEIPRPEPDLRARPKYGVQINPEDVPLPANPAPAPEHAPKPTPTPTPKPE